jgi:hypothetical protein
MRQRNSTIGFWTVQAAVIIAFAVASQRPAVGTGSTAGVTRRGGAVGEVVHITRETPLRVKPLYDDPEMVSDADLAAVLKQVQPRFPTKQVKPNYVEHALRIWGVDAKFRDPNVMSGEALKDFLTDHGRYLASWKDKNVAPLLVETRGGVSVRWGKGDGSSVHHDHWLACLTEAGVNLHEPIFTPGGHQRTINEALQQALRDFRLDEREVEWSALTFGLWLPDQTTWYTTDGREVTFDRLARRLIRGDKFTGVCLGTHRVFSMLVLLRLDDDHHILSTEVREEIRQNLLKIRQLIIDSQFEDGHWPSNWTDGKKAVEKPVDAPFYKTVIATGHHLEWQALAPEEFLIPREQLRKAARWVIDTTVARKPAEILEHYTFYSHVGGALSLWRSTRPTEFFQAWEDKHPPEPSETGTADAPESKDAKSANDH